MLCDLIIKDSWEPFIEYLKKTEMPIEICGHTRVGKSSTIKEIADRLNYNFVDISPYTFHLNNGKLCWHESALELLFSSLKPKLAYLMWANKQNQLVIAMDQF
jgi:cytidylate kinase